MAFFSRCVYLVHIVAEPLLEYHPFPSPGRYSKEQQGINFKQKGHLNIQTEENNGSINYIPGRRGSGGSSGAGKFFLHDLFPSLGAWRAEPWPGMEREHGGMGKCPTNWDPDRTKAAGEEEPWDLEAGKEDQEPGLAWMGQGINSKGRDVSHSSGEKGIEFRTSRRLKILPVGDNMESWNGLGRKRP